MNDVMRRNGYNDATCGYAINLDYQYNIEYISGFLEGLKNLELWDKE